jgi:hypothetical protein
MTHGARHPGTGPHRVERARPALTDDAEHATKSGRMRSRTPSVESRSVFVAISQENSKAGLFADAGIALKPLAPLL